MRSGQARLVTACQLLLALAVVAAVLAPAATVPPLDIVGPGSSPPEGRSGPAATAVAEVETAPVTPVVTEQALTAAKGRDARRRQAALPDLRTTRSGADRVVGDPEPAGGFRTVGVTWDRRERVAEGALRVEVRTRAEDGAWSGWRELEHHAEHGPDPGSREAAASRPGTEPLVLGDVAGVQVRATGDVPADLTVAVIDPGESGDTEVAAPAIDTGAAGDEPATDGAEVAAAPDGAEAAALSAGSFTPKPKIFSRAQWGADERMRDPRSLHYHEVHAGFVHHTVNGNSYSRSDVPGILRSIYAYHTRSRGWSDVGYNFLVDKFGRVWEGRYGGVDRPVVGAHTLGYNDDAFAMSAIGNFETTRPTQAMLRAYGRLMAWKLSLHGVAASSRNQQVAGRRLRAINGHRDAGSTACPGRYLYARLDAIRSMAAAAQRDFSGRERQTDLVSTPHPDIALRRASDDQVFLLPTGGLTRFKRPRPAASGWTGRAPVPTADVTGDGKSDVVAMGGGGGVLWAGNGAGSFTRMRTVRVLARKDLVTAVGDLDGDGKADLVGRRPNGAAVAFLGTGWGGFRARSLHTSWRSFRLTAGVGDVSGDGHPDVVARDADGRLRLLRGNGAGGFSAPTTVAGRWGGFNAVAGLGDFNRDGRNDLFARSKGGAGWVFPGRGDGTFTRPFGPVWHVHGLGGLAGGGTVSGTGAPDLVGVKGDQLLVARNTGRFDATEPRPTGLFLPDTNALLNVGDWDRDGHGDLLSRQRSTGRLLLHPGTTRGHFGAPRVVGTGFGRVGLLASVGDATGDGYPDLMGQPWGGAMRIYPGRGAGGIAPSFVAHSRIGGWRQIGFGRWNADGAPDSLVRTKDRLLLYPGNGPGGLETPRSLPQKVRPYDWFISLGDVERGKHPDIAVRHRRSGKLFLLRTNSSGFKKRRFLAEGIGRYDLYGR